MTRRTVNELLNPSAEHVIGHHQWRFSHRVQRMSPPSFVPYYGAESLDMRVHTEAHEVYTAELRCVNRPVATVLMSAEELDVLRKHIRELAAVATDVVSVSRTCDAYPSDGKRRAVKAQIDALGETLRKFEGI